MIDQMNELAEDRLDLCPKILLYRIHKLVKKVKTSCTFLTPY